MADEPTIRSTSLNFKNDLFSYKQMNMPSLVFLNYIHFLYQLTIYINLNHEHIVY